MISAPSHSIAINFPGPRRASLRRAGFTMLETLVLLGIFIVLLGIFIPYLLAIRESNRRTSCLMNLEHVFVALQAYAHDNAGDYPRVTYDPAIKPNGYSAFTGADDPNPFAVGSSVRPNDVTASLWLLVRGRYVTDTRVFICPSSDDTRDSMTNASGQAAALNDRSNFRRPNNLSYSYASPFSSAPGYKLNDTKPAQFVLMADKNPGEVAANSRADAPATQLAESNSFNHGGAGQNVLYAYGRAFFMKTPYCGIGNDNIYTARATSVHLSTQPATLPNNVPGVIGLIYSPVGNDDTYLVPTADDTAVFTSARIHAAAATTKSSTTSESQSTQPVFTTTVPATSSATQQ